MIYEELDFYLEAAMNVMDVPNSVLRPDGWNQLVELDKALGITEYREFFPRPASLDKPMNEELKKLLVLLAGPHGKTILKVYRIRKGLEGA